MVILNNFYVRLTISSNNSYICIAVIPNNSYVCIVIISNNSYVIHVHVMLILNNYLYPIIQQWGGGGLIFLNY